MTDQWRSQGLQVGWEQWVWGMEIPQQGPGAEPGEGLGAKPPEARYAYTICSGQTHFRDVYNRRYTVYLQAHVESATPLPPPYCSKTFQICANLTTHPG